MFTLPDLLSTFIAAVQSVISFSSASTSGNGTWDYIVVGAGAAGIPLADRLSETGKSVLLVERGFASSHRWGGAQRPAWLEGSNLTRFDVPAFFEYVWNTTDPVNSGVWCSDYAAYAGCVLGGGTAVNAGLWWKPTSLDWDLNFPPGWQPTDMASAVARAFSRLPWTDTPSKDGQLYLQNGPNSVIGTLTSVREPFRFLSANDYPDEKNRTVSHAEHFFLNGERGGPMATYLVTASSRPNFKLQMNTTVARIVREGPQVTGIAVESSGVGGLSGVIGLKPNTGKLILSAGVFGTSKILFRSGIGPKDQLEFVKASPEGSKMIAQEDWIELPVGYNLDDNPNAFFILTDNTFETYDSGAAYHNPIPADAKKYLESRSGPLAQIEPPVNPVLWDAVTGADNRTRYTQWSTNIASIGVIEGSSDDTKVIAFQGSLGLGKTSRGRLTLTSTPNQTLYINVSTVPYFNDPGSHDFAALAASASNLLPIVLNIPNATQYLPQSNTTIEEYFKQQLLPPTLSLSNNHWVGSTRMGECDSGDSVVDTETRVCGMKNLYVVDAGVVGGVPVANPQGMIVSVAERAAELIVGEE